MNNQGQGEIGSLAKAGQFAKDVGGTGLEIGSYATPVGIETGSEKAAAEAALQAGKTALKPSLLSLAKGGAVAGGIGSAGAELQNPNSTVGSVVKSGLLGAGFGGLLGAAVPAVGRTAGKVLNAGKEGAQEAGRFAASQLTGLSPETIKLAKSGAITNEALRSSPHELTQDLLTKVKNAFDDRFAKLKETGGEYEGVRSAPLLAAKEVPRAVSGLPQFVVDTLQNKFGIAVDDAGKLSVGAGSRATPKDIAGVQAVLDQYGKAPKLDANVILNTRQALDGIADYDGFYNGTADRIAKEIRSQYDKYAKTAVPGLAALDEKFAPEREFLGELRSALYENSGKQKTGEVRASAYSDISNLLSNAKVNKRTAIEKLVPGITDEVRVLKALQDVEHATGQKVGTYTRSAAGVGLGSGLLATGNLPAGVAALLYGVFGTPKNFIKAIRAFGEADRKYGTLIIEKTIQDILKGKKLSGKSVELIKAAIIAAQRGAVITKVAP